MDVDLSKVYDKYGQQLAIVDLTKKKARNKRPFVMMVIGGDAKAENPILNQQLTHFEVHLLMTIVLLMDFDNEFRMSQKELADHFGCHPPRISKAMQILKKKGLIKEIRRGVFFVDPLFASRGK